MKKLVTTLAAGWCLFGAMPLSGAQEYTYSMVIEETLKQAWIAEVTPKALMKSRKGTFTIHDKVSGCSRQIDKKGQLVGVSEFNIVDFCIQDKIEPLCREVIISDFSYDGLAGLLLGGRGERLKYIVLASCEQGEKSCRYPHLKLGPNFVLKLQQEGIRAHQWSEEGKDYVVAGPFPQEEVETKLQRVRLIIPNAYIN